jgi:hypothetical protein
MSTPFPDALWNLIQPLLPPSPLDPRNPTTNVPLRIQTAPSFSHGKPLRQFAFIRPSGSTSILSRGCVASELGPDSSIHKGSMTWAQPCARIAQVW